MLRHLFKSLRPDHPVGLLFDVDGLLIDNTREIHLAYQSLLANRGVVMEGGERFPGINLFDILERMKRKYALSSSVEELVAERRDEYLRILSRGTFDLCDGVAELFGVLDGLRGCDQVRFAYVSSSEKCFTDILFRNVFDRIGLPQYASDPDGFFFRWEGVAANTAWEPRLQKKPHPMLYQLACQKLALDPSQCIAFEDAPSGWVSALDAGLNLVVIQHESDHQTSSDLIRDAERQGRVYAVKSLREFLPFIESLSRAV
jgi:beta-phosphoglucomutase-like phosphatase (HAD superfamily)